MLVMNMNIENGSAILRLVYQCSPRDSFSLKTLLVMKLFFFLTFALSFSVLGDVLGQKVTVQVRQASFKSVVKEVQRQSGYSFIMKDELLRQAKAVTIHVSGQDVLEMLPMLFRNQPFGYQVNGKIISAMPLTETTVSPVVVSPVTVLEQQSPTQGRVTNELGEPLVGASVRVRGQDKATLTDQNGRFLLNDVPRRAILEISYIGYTALELRATNDLGTIMLKGEAADLQEVVVSTGYQQLPRERATGSFAAVSNELLSRKPTMNVLDRLEGLAGGLVFHRNSASGEPSLVVRGRSTIYGDDQPLVVVDGFPIEGSLNSINPNDVENITILRDAAAASIWGVRAANGVIVVSTRRGAFNERPTIELRSQALVGDRPDLSYLPYMSSSDYIDLERAWYQDGRYDQYLSSPLDELPTLSEVVQQLMDVQQGRSTQQQADAYLNDLRGVDVRKEYADVFYRNRVHQQHQFNMRGGSERVRYMFSAGYDRDQSSERGNGTDRITLRGDNTYQIMKSLQLNVSLNHAWNGQQHNAMGLYGFQGETGGNLGSVDANQYAFYPYQRLRDAQGNAISIARDVPFLYDQQLQQQYGMQDWSYRPADEINLRDNQTKQQYSRIAAGLEYKLPLGFSADLRYQFERDVISGRDLRPLDMYSTRDLINTYSVRDPNGDNGLRRAVPVGDVLISNAGQRSSHNFRGQLNYNGGWAEHRHRLSGIVGMEVRDILYDNMLNSFYGYDDRTLQYTDMDKMASYEQFTMPFALPFEFGGGIQDRISQEWNRYASFYSNVSYTYLDRYVVSASGRIDKSSLFGVNPADRNVPLWSSGLAWNISRESFFPTSGIFSELRFRSTYGFNGNVSAAQTSFPIAWAGRDFMTRLPTANITSPANPLLQWEKVSQLNLAVDFGLWNNRLSGRLEWFTKRGQDLFGDHFLDPSSGFSTIQANVATMQGRGFDFELNARIGSVLRWDTKLLFSHAIDRVEDIALIGSGSFSSGVTAGGGFLTGNQGYMLADREVFPLSGRPVYALYSYAWGGLDSDGNPQLLDEHGALGDYASILGSLPADKLVYHGPAQPRFYGGWTHNLFYKGIGLTTTLTYKLGHYFRRSSINYYGLAGTDMFRSTGHSDYALRWREPGDEARTDVPAYPGYNLFDTYRDEAYRYADILVESASHVRLKDITLSYNLKGKWMESLSLRSAQIYAYVDNVGILWRANKHGIDPDFVPMGYSNFLPLPRTYTFGITVGF
ncbi:SusC/RagA family TonB-linked outer membrane protein [Sphingobacterium alkalisoli]|uniref:SusC/RagA family TonB-linked outer membrane protein n=2 Tax=Sphingobacterium alkalisoli TaxID=1874115 RepID=A0A4U0GR32_9SPHI|nr:SusC/RagA family TonB-linked outer membrane protein [Sphingobacterium alkalisoli]GGH30571.1 SusC/RagA family TonB-linked outer membrane protein [Sphingobacterium alkalisoli]